MVEKVVAAGKFGFVTVPSRTPRRAGGTFVPRVVEPVTHSHTCIAFNWLFNPLPTVGNSLKKQKSLYKVLTPS